MLSSHRLRGGGRGGCGGCGGRGRRVCGWRAGGRGGRAGGRGGRASGWVGGGGAGGGGVALSVAATCRLIEFSIIYSQ
jgi:hypothetical protein